MARARKGAVNVFQFSLSCGGRQESPEMKKVNIVLFVLSTFVLGYMPLYAQDMTVEKDSVPINGEEGPIIYKFEPDYLLSAKARKQRMERGRAILDTMDISERKRRKLLIHLYKDRTGEGRSKTMLADTKFEDIED